MAYETDAITGNVPPVSAGDPLVDVRGVHKFFDDLHVLRGVDLQVHPGKVLVVTGPSGSGKSTVLRCINQLETISAGRIFFNGELLSFREDSAGVLSDLSDREIAQQRAKIGMVFQRFNLFPHFTALQNVMEAPMKVRGMSKGASRQLALNLLAQVGLADRASHYPSELSGGQQQRVAIARALAMEPELMLFDEPTSALDPELVGEVLKVMQDTARAGMSMIVVTHEIGFAREVADEVIFMDEGVVVERGRPAAVIDNPQNQRTAEFFAKVL